MESKQNSVKWNKINVMEWNEIKQKTWDLFKIMKQKCIKSIKRYKMKNEIKRNETKGKEIGVKWKKRNTMERMKQNGKNSKKLHNKNQMK